MSSDNQFTALGPTIVGFQTDGANIDRGAEIAGNQIGVKGTCIGPVGDGVQGHGSGNFSGVAGFGGGNAGTGVIGVGGIGPGEFTGGPGVRGLGANAPNSGPPGNNTAVGVYGQGANQCP